MPNDLERIVGKRKAELSQAQQAKQQFGRPRTHSPVTRAIRYFTMDKEQRRRSRAARLAFRHR